jgi:hypothetical protein
MIQPGSFVITHLQNPKEKFWGLLVDLTASGVTVYGLDLNSFEDWTRMIVSNGRNIGLTAIFIPMWRIERVTLDQTIDDLLSLQAQFEVRVGIPLKDYLDAQLAPSDEEAEAGTEM